MRTKNANNTPLSAFGVWAAADLILRKGEFFLSTTRTVAVVNRYPQNVFAEHTHEFCELVLVWRGSGLHVLNDRTWRIIRDDLFYIRAEDKHSYASVNGLVLQNIIYYPERLRLNFDWAGTIPGLFGTPWKPRWRVGNTGMAQARQVISQPEHECVRQDTQGNAMAELLFAQLALTLQRHRYATDDPTTTQREALLGRLLAALAASLSHPFILERFCEQEGGSEQALRQQFRQQTGMTINHYLRQLRIHHAQYLLQHTERLIGDIAIQYGFEDNNCFSVVFSQEVDMPPGQWRQYSRVAA